MKKNKPKRNERNAVHKRMSFEIKTSFKFHFHHFLVIFFGRSHNLSGLSYVISKVEISPSSTQDCFADQMRIYVNSRARVWNYQ